MSDETKPQDSAAMPPASVGSQPVAWAVFDADGCCIGTYATQAQARNVVDDLGYDGWVYEPLYRQPGPTLADDERLAVEWAATVAREQSQVALHKTLRSLLKRLG